MHPLVLVGLGEGVGEGLGLGVRLGLGNQVAISTRGVHLRNYMHAMSLLCRQLRLEVTKKAIKAALKLCACMQYDMRHI